MFSNGFDMIFNGSNGINWKERFKVKGRVFAGLEDGEREKFIREDEKKE